MTTRRKKKDPFILQRMTYKGSGRKGTGTKNTSASVIEPDLTGGRIITGWIGNWLLTDFKWIYATSKN